MVSFKICYYAFYFSIIFLCDFSDDLFFVRRRTDATVKFFTIHMRSRNILKAKACVPVKKNQKKVTAPSQQAFSFAKSLTRLKSKTITSLTRSMLIFTVSARKTLKDVKIYSG